MARYIRVAGCSAIVILERQQEAMCDLLYSNIADYVKWCLDVTSATGKVNLCAANASTNTTCDDVT